MLIIQPFNGQPAKVILEEPRFAHAVKGKREKKKKNERNNALISPRQQLCISDAYFPIFQVPGGDKMNKRKEQMGLKAEFS